MLYAVWYLTKSQAHKNNCKKQLVGKNKNEKRKEKRREKRRATGQVGTNVRARVFNAGLLARNHFASGRSCDRPTRSRFSVVFIGLRANAELVPKFHVALHAPHAALTTLTLKVSPYTNVTLTFDFLLDHLFMGDMGEGFLHEEERK
jgi:hypothetical protein